MLNDQIEVIAKSPEKVFKIINITRKEYHEMEKKKGFTYQPFQLGFSAYQNAEIIDFKKQTCQT